MADKNKGFTRRDFLKTTGSAAGLGALLTAPGCVKANPPDRRPRGLTIPKPPAGVKYIDVHAHLFGLVPAGGGEFDNDFQGAAKVAMAAMDKYGIQKTLIMPPPLPPNHPHSYDVVVLMAIVKKYPVRFGCLAGGGSLNPMIQQAVHAGRTSRHLTRKFEQAARDVISKGALGFGELTAEHFSFRANHPYETAPPDHPLFLRLADLAAKYGVPIDIHMEAIDRPMALPSHLWSPNNPKRLKPNIAAFERLLGHNRRARIIWSHAGWGHTGRRTPALMDALMLKHPNLYMSLKIHPHSVPQNRPLMMRGRAIKPEWLTLIRTHSDRFLLGTDQFHLSPHARTRFPRGMWGPLQLLSLLPPGLARKVGYDNAKKVFKIDS